MAIYQNYPNMIPLNTNIYRQDSYMYDSYGYPRYHNILNATDNYYKLFNDPIMREYLDTNNNKYGLVMNYLYNTNELLVDEKLLRLVAMRNNFLQKTESRYSNYTRGEPECINVRSDVNMKQLCYSYNTPLSEEQEDVLLSKLQPKIRMTTPIKYGKDEIVVTNLHITHDNLISLKEREVAEGGHIMEWVETNLIFFGGSNSEYYNSYVFSDLVMLQAYGYIYMARAGINFIELFSGIPLKYYPEQIGKPIDHMFYLRELEKFAEKPVDNQTERIDEITKILSSEYYICLQPRPQYLLYTIKRLIVAWYADAILSTTIIKIKVIINTYRSRRDINDNMFGVMPVIQIYLRNGPVNAQKVLDKINYFFTNYTYIGAIDQYPDYFSQVNNLIYYCNGNPDVKRYMYARGLDKKFNMLITPSLFKYGIDIQPISPSRVYDLREVEYVSKFAYETR